MTADTWRASMYATTPVGGAGLMPSSRNPSR